MRGIKIKNHYQGGYFKPLDKTKDIDGLQLEIVNNSELAINETYMIDTGSTVKYLGDGVYEIIDRTPLRSGIKVKDLNDRCLNLFWTLVKNCKNGTYFGV